MMTDAIALKDMSRSMTTESSLVPLSTLNPFDSLTPEQISEWAGYHLQYVDFKDVVNEEGLHQLPDFPGLYFVYFIIYDSKGKWTENLVYIGIATTSISQRWKSNHQVPLFGKMHKLGIEILVRTFTLLPGMVTAETLQMWEQSLIQKLHPVFNEEI